MLTSLFERGVRAYPGDPLAPKPNRSTHGAARPAGQTRPPLPALGVRPPDDTGVPVMEAAPCGGDSPGDACAHEMSISLRSGESGESGEACVRGGRCHERGMGGDCFALVVGESSAMSREASRMLSLAQPWTKGMGDSTGNFGVKASSLVTGRGGTNGEFAGEEFVADGEPENEEQNFLQ